MNYAIVEEGKVVNIIVADEAFAESIRGNHEAVVAIVGEQPHIGWAYSAEAGFINPNPPKQPEPEAPPANS